MEKVYVDKSGGKFQCYCYSDGDRYLTLDTYDWSAVERYARKYGFEIVRIF